METTTGRAYVILYLRPHDWQTYPTVMVCDPDLKASRLWGRLHGLGKDSPLWIKGVRDLK
jgi:hypothetical protein